MPAPAISTFKPAIDRPLGGRREKHARPRARCRRSSSSGGSLKLPSSMARLTGSPINSQLNVDAAVVGSSVTSKPRLAKTLKY